MSRNKAGVAIFLGLIGATALASSDRFLDTNAVLDNFRPVVGQATDIVEKTVLTAEEKLSVTEDEQNSIATGQVLAAPEANNAEKTIDNVDGSDQQVVEIKPEQEVQAEIATPTFDVLRVEPSGDMVIAGVSSPKAIMELVAGTKILTQTRANDNGEFVATLDEALEPGDYEIVLRSTTPEGAVMTSAETAIVSIPDAGSNDVIALVEAPGAPSRLITVPSAQTALVPVKPKADTENPASKQITVPEAELALAPEFGEEVEQNSDSPAEEEIAIIETSEGKNTEQEREIEIASAPEVEDEEETAKPVSTLMNPIRIEAVEIDGPTVFVAGAADAGTKLRVYANEILLGDALASAEGRFLIDVNRDLPVGDYIIRADALAANDAEVLARVAVPFTREEGQKLAAVAIPSAPRLPNTAPQISALADEKKQNNDDMKPAKAQEDVALSKQENIIVPRTADTDAVVSVAPETRTANLEERLTPVRDSVVIRRGDTLWKISRRVYGRGIKYTTIYQANQEQIANPHRIWPGQVFTLPERAETQSN